MAFVSATNTGKGFITHADRNAFTLNGVAPDVYEVSGDYQAWVSRVGGVELTGADAADVQKALDNVPLIAQIELEESKQSRSIREAVLGQAGAVARLQAIDDKIAALRARLA